MPDHGASAFESEEGNRRDLSFKTVPWLPASGYDPPPIARAPFISRGAATTSDVVRGPCEEAAGSQVSCRRATVSSGCERAEEKKVEGRDRA